MYIHCNMMCYILTRYSQVVLAEYAKIANIPDEYAPRLNMKNEFLYLRMILGGKKKFGTTVRMMGHDFAWGVENIAHLGSDIKSIFTQGKLNDEFKIGSIAEKINGGLNKDLGSPKNAAKAANEKIKQLGKNIEYDYTIHENIIHITGNISIIKCPEEARSIMELEDTFDFIVKNKDRSKNFYTIDKHIYKEKKRYATILRILENAINNDGFYIAEEDLKLRGSGEILGKRQSGYQEYLIADFENHYHLFIEASQYAKSIIKDNNKLYSKPIQI